MLVLILAYLGGALTILGPCILPVLPFVFARSDRPFMRTRPEFAFEKNPRSAPGAGPGRRRRADPFRVMIAGKPPGADHGMDTDNDGTGTVDSQR
ncbi:MAG: hypothetical protein M3Y93_12605, partial [Pseudomonadota bacterium]|nr:hypothetical protein [Pseudomonadota bacterium]